MRETRRLYRVLSLVGLLLIGCQTIAEDRWPQTATVTATPTQAVSSPEPELTSVIGSILHNPDHYLGQEVTIVGYYRGWDLLGEVGSGPPVTRSDWVIADSTGAIYVAAHGTFDQVLGLDPNSTDDTIRVLRLDGVVRVSDGGQPYIEPQQLQMLGMFPSETLVVTVAVQTVEVRALESLPQQIELVIKGDLPDDCEYQLVASEERDGQMVNITLEGQRPADLACTAESQPVTYTLLLEGGFEPGDYTLAVNDYQTSFSVRVDG